MPLNATDVRGRHAAQVASIAMPQCAYTLAGDDGGGERAFGLRLVHAGGAKRRSNPSNRRPDTL